MPAFVFVQRPQGALRPGDLEFGSFYVAVVGDLAQEQSERLLPGLATTQALLDARVLALRDRVSGSPHHVPALHVVLEMSLEVASDIGRTGQVGEDQLNALGIAVRTVLRRPGNPRHEIVSASPGDGVNPLLELLAHRGDRTLDQAFGFQAPQLGIDLTVVRRPEPPEAHVELPRQVITRGGRRGEGTEDREAQRHLYSLA